jgi:hypothetical protein
VVVDPSMACVWTSEHCGLWPPRSFFLPKGSVAVVVGAGEVGTNRSISPLVARLKLPRRAAAPPRAPRTGHRPPARRMIDRPIAHPPAQLPPFRGPARLVASGVAEASKADAAPAAPFRWWEPHDYCLFSLPFAGSRPSLVLA